MKKIFALTVTALSLFTMNSFAASIPVTVQCDVTGPVYKGVLDFDLNPKNWTVLEGCKFGSGTLNHPPLSLLLNGIEYTSKSGSVHGTFRNDCSGDVGNIDDDIRAQNPNTGFGVDLHMHYDSSGQNKSLTITKLKSNGNYCSVRTD